MELYSTPESVLTISRVLPSPDPVSMDDDQAEEEAQEIPNAGPVDVKFIVGTHPAKRCFYCHKILLEKISPIFLTMLSSRWMPEEECNCVELPEFNPIAFNMVIDFIYQKDLTFFLNPLRPDIKLTDGSTLEEWKDVLILLEVLNISDVYEMPKLSRKCSKYIIPRISKDNCIRIWQSIRYLKDKQEISFKAIVAIKKNLATFLQQDQVVKMEVDVPVHWGIVPEHLNSIPPSSWCEELWVELLEQDDLCVEEIELFRALITTEFKSLLRKIRYPLMSPEQFEKEVQPLGILNEDEVKLMHSYFEQGDAVDLPFLTTPRTNKVAYNSEDLTQFLSNVTDGDNIFLLQGTYYYGRFTLKGNGVTLKSQGPAPSIIIHTGYPEDNGPFTALQIEGNGCTVENISIVVHKRRYHSPPCMPNHKKIDPLLPPPYQIQEHSVEVFGLRLHGNGNKLLKIKCKNIDQGTSILVQGNENYLEEIACENPLIAGLCIRGDENQVENVTCLTSNTMPVTDLQVKQRSCGVVVESGTGNHFRKVYSSGFLQDFTFGPLFLEHYKGLGVNWGLEVKEGAKRNVFREVTSSGVKLGGEGNCLIEVAAGGYLVVEGVSCKLNKCRAGKFWERKNCTEIGEGCKFGERL